MALIGQKFIELCTEFQGQAYVVISLCCIIMGGVFAFSDDGTEKLKKRLPFIVLGWILICGAITLGSNYGSSLQF